MQRDFARRAGLGRDARHTHLADRVRGSRTISDALAPHVPARERERLSRLLIVLTSSARLCMRTELLHVTADMATDDVGWAIRSMATGAATGAGAP